MSTERRIEVTTSAWITEPEQFHYVLGQINKKRPIGAELYPISHRLPISEQTASKIPIRAIQENLYAFRDGRISIKKIRVTRLRSLKQISSVILKLFLKNWKIRFKF